MTDLLTRPLLRVNATASEPQRPVALSAIVAAVGSAVVGISTTIVLAVLAWFTASSGSFPDAIRVGGLAWLVGNGGGLHLTQVTLTTIPLGSCLWSGYLLYRGGRWAGRHSKVESLGGVLVASVVMGAGYAAAGVTAVELTGSEGAHADAPRTLTAALALGLLFGGLGILRGSGRSEEVLSLLPDELRAALTGGVAGLFTMVALSGLALVIAVGAHFSDTTSRAESMHAGVIGGALLALGGLALLPNAILCSGAYLAGPGFLLGTGTAVTPGQVLLGPLPALPLLGALPRSGGAWWQSALLVLPVLAGGVAGLVAMRRFPVPGYYRVALRGGLAGLVGGMAFGASTWLATGAVGPGRMQDIGPDVPATLLVCSLALLLGGVVAAAGACWLGGSPGRWRLLWHRADSLS